MAQIKIEDLMNGIQANNDAMNNGFYGVNDTVNQAAAAVIKHQDAGIAQLEQELNDGLYGVADTVNQVGAANMKHTTSEADRVIANNNSNMSKLLGKHSGFDWFIITLIGVLGGVIAGFLAKYGVTSQTAFVRINDERICDAVGNVIKYTPAASIDILWPWIVAFVVVTALAAFFIAAAFMPCGNDENN